MKSIDYKQISAYYEYSPETGVITNKISRRRAKAGEVATVDGGKGYLRLAFNYQQLQAHRVAWVLHHRTDIDAEQTIDHINGDRQDNRICNLRLLSVENNAGRLGRARGIQPIRGEWRARIKCKGKTYYGKQTPCPLIAHINYLDMIPAYR